MKTVGSSPIPPLRSEYVHTSTEWKKPDRHFRFQVRAQLRPVTKITPFEITVLMCEQEPYPVWFSCRRNRQELYINYYPVCTVNIALCCNSMRAMSFHNL